VGAVECNVRPEQPCIAGLRLTREDEREACAQSRERGRTDIRAAIDEGRAPDAYARLVQAREGPLENSELRARPRSEELAELPVGRRDNKGQLTDLDSDVRCEIRGLVDEAAACLPDAGAVKERRVVDVSAPRTLVIRPCWEE